jgi:hypothetical protein
MSGVASLWTRLFFEMPPRVFSTATSRLCTFSLLASLPSTAARLTKVSELPVRARP